jgi:predicted Holliday junction resolvase-like endonuclease
MFAIGNNRLKTYVLIIVIPIVFVILMYVTLYFVSKKVKNEFREKVALLYEMSIKKNYDEIVKNNVASENVIRKMKEYEKDYGFIKQFEISVVYGEFGGSAGAEVTVYRKDYITIEHLSNVGTDRIMFIRLMSSKRVNFLQKSPSDGWEKHK